MLPAITLASTQQVAHFSTSTTACGASSIRFKQNIAPITYGLDAVKLLNPVSFDWKAGLMPNATHQIGFIAEEVESIIPEVIGYHDGQIQSVDYPKLTAVLTRAVQELNTKVDGLTNTPSSSRSSNSSRNSSSNSSLPIGQASSTTAPVIVDNSLVGQIIAFLNTLYDVVIERGLLKVANIISNKISTDELCVGKICVTEEEFEEVFGKGHKSSRGSGGQTASEEPQITVEVKDDEDEKESETEDTESVANEENEVSSNQPNENESQSSGHSDSQESDVTEPQPQP